MLFDLDPFKTKKQKETGRGGVEEQFVKAVQHRGGRAFKFVSINNRGVSDRVVFLPGQVWFVEIKREDGKLTELQKTFRELALRSKANYFVVQGAKGIQEFFLAVKEKQNDLSRKA